MSRDLPPLQVERLRTLTEGLAVGRDLRYLPAIGSTNEVAHNLLPGEWTAGTVIITDFQEAGRGRGQHGWSAPSNSSLLLSVLLSPAPRIRPTDAIMAGALSVVEAVDQVTGVQAGIKWPNDILVSTRKLCGILAESSMQRGTTRIILGIGLNVNIPPADLDRIPGEATSLLVETGQLVDREVLAATLFCRLDLWYGVLNRDADRVFSTWSSRLTTIGRHVRVEDAGGEWQGLATGVLRDGGLQVRDHAGRTHEVHAADVSVRDEETLQTPESSVE